MTPDQLRAKINHLKLKRSKLDLQKAMVSFELREAERELNNLEGKK